jgi:lipopolysaccharide transport system ATP-binding protein
MADVAIRIRGLGKRYKIGRTRPYRTVRESIVEAVIGSVRRRRTGLSADADAGTEQTFWALKDLSLEVNRGEVVGVIGRNGAGKSTLLKILSRITEPTEGNVEIRGRVGSLLEVGTGFHPELTGRENIYLNGAILGMRRQEIRTRFDEIVAFSEIAEFLDTPVKHYSTGMHMRLAFAVAAHLEPEILLVDEVLAVGDSAFQRKCLGKMGDVARQGRTVVFVSHQLAAIQSLCSRAALLEHGRLTTQGDCRKVIDLYLSSTESEHSTPLRERVDREGTGMIRFHSMHLRGDGDKLVLQSGAAAALVLSFWNSVGVTLQNVEVALGIDDTHGQRIALLSNEFSGDYFDNVPTEVSAFEFRIPRMPLLPGRYSVSVFAWVNGVMADSIQDAGHFDVVPGDFHGTGKLPPEGHLLLEYHCALSVDDWKAPSR